MCWGWGVCAHEGSIVQRPEEGVGFPRPGLTSHRESHVGVVKQTVLLSKAGSALNR